MFEDASSQEPGYKHAVPGRTNDEVMILRLDGEWRGSSSETERQVKRDRGFLGKRQIKASPVGTGSESGSSGANKAGR
jgi:hypothetical protein